MSDSSQAWASDWSVGMRVWVERGGRAILGEGRLELLEGIDRHRSISAAARAMGMSYRRAWLLVQAANEAAAEPLVIAAPGGSHGGGAALTPQGRRMLGVFRELHQRLRQSAAALLPQLTQGPESPTVHVAAAVSLEEVLGQLLADYALRQPGTRVRVIFGASDELADHLLASAPGDLFLSADPRQLERLGQAGLLAATAGVLLAENSLAAIGPDHSTVRGPRDLAHLGEGRLALADPSSPLGRYTRSYLESLGFAKDLLLRATVVDNSRAVVAAVRAGDADVGLVYASDAQRADGCRLLFKVRQAPEPIHYKAAVLHRGRPTEPAESLLAFLTFKIAARRFRRCGFLPVASM